MCQDILKTRLHVYVNQTVNEKGLSGGLKKHCTTNTRGFAQN